MNLRKGFGALRTGEPGLRLLALVACLCFWATLLAQQPEPPSPAPTQTVNQQASLSPALKELLSRGFALRDKNQAKESREQFERALALARDEKNRWAEAEGHRGLGLLLLDGAEYPAARTEFEQALSTFLSLNDAASIAGVHLHLGGVAELIGNREEARALNEKGLAEYRSLGDLSGQLRALVNLVYTGGITANEKQAHRQEGLVLARQLGERALEGRLLHEWGDDLFEAGDSAGALEKLQQAAGCLEDVHNQFELARVLTSLGRLQRLHGAYEEAIWNYERALAIQQEIGDKLGVIQSLNAEAISYYFLKKDKESIEHYERALALARETGSHRVIAFMTGNVGGAYNDKGNYKRAIDLLEESLRLDPSSVYAANRHTQLSEAYRQEKQYEQALKNANEAVRLTRKGDNPDGLYQALEERALLYQDLKGYPEALTDIQGAIHAVEQVRARLVPADYLKQGYAGRTQDLFAEAIQIHQQLGQHKEALVTAEEARARALLDLLASRGLENRVAPSEKVPGTKSTPASSQTTTRVSQETHKPESSGSVALTTRGAAPLKLGGMGVTPVLPSPSSAAPASMEEMISTAKRLDSTVLSYWVSPETTFLWLLNPDGSIRSGRVAVTSDQLSKLVQATETAQEELQAEPTAQPKDAAGASRKSGPSQIPAMALRGGGRAVLSEKQAWRELYKLLIQPLRQSLPQRGSLLTIVPHGPLFQLSFAALLDERGHYLVEDYALNYTPSLGILRLTAELKQQNAHKPPRFLLVADPAGMPPLPDRKRLPALPGSRHEVAAISRLLPKGEVTELVGEQASEDRVREALPNTTVIHFATHGIVFDDQPFDSFIALGASGTDSSHDGRLTAQEIYGLGLHSDLVFLSACRSARGRISGDGIMGLTRAFFYAGTPSVVATLWDVADKPTQLLASDFYRSLLKHHDKSRALRDAQLHLLHSLRAGRVRIDTPVGPVTLPENPIFWASFVLQGEP